MTCKISIENSCTRFTEADSMTLQIQLLKSFNICANAMNHQRFMELLKEIEDNEFNDLMFFANAHWLSCG